jgi:hypothetical protein
MADRPRLRVRCINCHTTIQPRVCTYWYGFHDVGPFCEACDRLIKVHTRFVDTADAAETSALQPEPPIARIAREQRAELNRLAAEAKPR